MTKSSLKMAKKLAKSREINNSFFHKQIREIIKGKKNFLITNDNEDDAIEILSSIFRYSEDTVHLFANNKKANVSNNPLYELAVRDFLRREGKVFLVLNRPIDKIEKAFLIYKLLAIYEIEKPQLVQIVVADETFKSDVKKIFKGELCNFCVGDKEFVRVEYDTSKFSAKANYSPELGKELSQIIQACIHRTKKEKKDEVVNRVALQRT